MAVVPFIKNEDIEKFYDSGNVIIIEGTAATTARDITGDVASKNFISKLAADLPNRPMYYNHKYSEPPIGRVLETKLQDDGNRLWTKCEIYKTRTNENIIKGLDNGSLRFLSVGAVGRRVINGTLEGGVPVRIFDDGYGQELTLTGVPINPTAAFKIAKSLSEDLISKGYNNFDLESLDSNPNLYRKAVQDVYGIDIIQEKERIANQMEEYFMKNEGAVMQNYWDESGHTNGRYDTLNPPAAQSTPGTSDLRPFGGQLAPMTIGAMVQKCMNESSNPDDFVGRFNWELRKQAMNGNPEAINYLRSLSGGMEQLNPKHGMDGGNFAGAEGFMAKVIGDAVLQNLARSQAPVSYGVNPADREWMVSNMKKVDFREVGYDEPFVTQSAGVGVESMGPVGMGKNPGVNPMDQEWLKQGLKPLPTGLSEGYVNSGLTTVRKAEDLLGDPRFMSYIHHSKYVGQLGRGKDETPVQYMHRLLEERNTVSAEPFRRAMDKEIVAAINEMDTDNLSLEDAGRIQHIMNDFTHGNVFAKCMQESIYGELNEDEDFQDFMRADEDKDMKKKKHSEPDGDEGKNPKKKSDDDGDEEEDGKKMPPWLKGKKFKKAEDEPEDDEEDDDEDEPEDDEDDEEDNEDMKKSEDDINWDDFTDEELDEMANAIDLEEDNFTKSLITQAVRDRIERDQAEADRSNYVKGMTSDKKQSVSARITDPVERAFMKALTTGEEQS